MKKETKKSINKAAPNKVIKPIQIIAVKANPSGDVVQVVDMLLALCDDGTVWWTRLRDTSEEWQPYMTKLPKGET